ncbi:MAG: class I SAM-dependent methyltransferase [Candidatus Lokiarchaeota archaeon]|nr:class I SAM-dependent methyltransferase [Candidatus Lokiarchaeota archaeon]
MVDPEEEHRHVHGGRSTRGLINPTKLLQKIGVRPGDTLLDLGCGDGYISLEAATHFVGTAGKVHAIDIVPESIDQVKAQARESNASNIEAAVADATTGLPLPDGCIDTCLVANVLHGFVVNKEVDLVFKELLRVMKHGGKIVIVEFKKKKYLPGPRFEERLSPDDVDAILAAHGGRRIATFNAGTLHYARVFIV